MPHIRTSAAAEESPAGLKRQTCTTSFVAYPFCLYKSERPDFLAVSGGHEIGIEITEAIAQNVAHADSLTVPPSHFFDFSLDCMQVDAPRSSRIQLEGTHGRKLTGPGWCNDDAERQQERELKYFITRKHENFQDHTFLKFEKNHLIIYNNSRAWVEEFNNKQQLMELIRRWYFSDMLGRLFEGLIILDNNNRDLFFLTAQSASYRKVTLPK